MKKKITILAALAVFALAAAFVIGCIQPIDVDMGGLSVGSARSAKGIYLSFDSSSSGRTILPSAPTTTVYTVVFKDNTDNAVGGTSFPVENVDRATLEAINFADTGYLASLPAGSYKVIVTARDMSLGTSGGSGWGYAEGDDTQTFAAAIDANTNATFVVKLEYFDRDTTHGNGRFIYNTSWSKFKFTPDSASISIEINSVLDNTPVPTYTSNIKSLLPKTDTSFTLDLQAGYYNVVYTVEVNGMTSKYREVLHVYQNMVSTFELIDDSGTGIGISNDDPFPGGITVVVTDPYDPELGLKITFDGNAAWWTGQDDNEIGILTLSASGDGGNLEVTEINDYTLTGNSEWSIVTPFYDLGTGTTKYIEYDDFPAPGVYTIQVQNGPHTANFKVLIL